jgi:hypothetical protein
LICWTYQDVVCLVCRAVCDWVTESLGGFVTYLLFCTRDWCRRHVVHWLVYRVGGTVACKRFPSNSFEGLCDMVLIVLRFPLRFQSHVCYLVCATHKQMWDYWFVYIAQFLGMQKSMLPQYWKTYNDLFYWLILHSVTIFWLQKHFLPPHCWIYNDVFSLTISTKLSL